MPLPFLADLVVILLASSAVLYLSSVLRLPAIVGLLLAGALLGPHGLELVHGAEEVHQLAEIGVILLLFTIGLEFSLAELLRMRRVLLVGGTVQVTAVTAVVWAALSAAGVPSGRAFFLGLIASLSSTAMVLRILQQRAEMGTPHGRVSLGILIYQDLMIVPMMLLIPILSGTGGTSAGEVLVFAGKAVAIVAATLVLARRVVPAILERVVRTRSRDLFLLAVVTLCLAAAWAANSAGLSLALGAFLAGLLISESEYSHQALADILPFRDLFASFFFLSIGMLLDVPALAAEPLGLGAAVLGVVAVKFLAAALAVLALGGSLATAVAAGLLLGQVGEFSFVLAEAGSSSGLLSERMYQWFVAASVVTMGLTPLLASLVEPAVRGLGRLRLPHAWQDGSPELEPPTEEPDEGWSEHVIVVGYGVIGSNVVRAARLAEIPCVAVDLDPVLVAQEREKGVPLFYGDGTNPKLLELLGVSRAHAVVVALPDAAAARAATAAVRAHNHACTVVVRTRYIREVEALMDLGATYVIPEELEASVEIVARLLRSYLVPEERLEAFLAEIRAAGYERLREPFDAAVPVGHVPPALRDLEVSTVRITEGSPLAGRSLAQAEVRRKLGVSVAAIRRGARTIPNPDGDARIEPGDLVVLLGAPDRVAAAAEILSRPGATVEGPATPPERTPRS